MAGLVSVPIYPSTTAAQCAFILEDSGTEAVIAENAEQADKLATQARAGLRIIAVDALPSAESPITAPIPSLAELRTSGVAWSTAHPGELDRRADAVAPGDCFTIIYTSGTTGQPKGVVLTHANLVASCESAVRAFDLRPTDVQYLFLPLAHVLGREVEWAPIIVGSQVAFAESLARIKHDLTEVRPTFMAGVPRIFEKLYAAVQAAAKQGSRAKQALVGWAFGVAARAAGDLRAGRRLATGLRFSHALANRLVLSRAAQDAWGSTAAAS